MKNPPDSENRIPVGQYDGNNMYRGMGGTSRYCYGHKAHRSAYGAKMLGPLKLFYCAECVAAREAKKAKE